MAVTANCGHAVQHMQTKLYSEVLVLIFASINSQFRKAKPTNLHLAHILLHECDNVLDGLWGPGDGCRLDTGSILWLILSV